MLNNALQDSLVSLKNGFFNNKRVVILKYSALVLKILILLKNEGILDNFLIIKNYSFVLIKVFLKYDIDGKNIVQQIDLFNNRKQAFYLSSKVLNKMFFKNNVVVLSTPFGLMTQYEAVCNKIGGVLLLRIKV